MKNIILLSFLIYYKVNAQADFIEPMSKDLFLSDWFSPLRIGQNSISE
jgi:hypothetical protein